MAACVPSPLVISVSFMDHDVLDQLLNEFEIDHEEDVTTRPAEASPDAVSSVTSNFSFASPVEAKPIRPELDPLPLASTQERTEYYTVNDYVWPTPKKRECKRMPEEERRQRHRESQREFMTRKRSQFRAMRAEISHLEKQLRWLEARKMLKTLTLEQQTLETKLGVIVAGIQRDMWKNHA